MADSIQHIHKTSQIKPMHRITMDMNINQIVSHTSRFPFNGPGGTRGNSSGAAKPLGRLSSGAFHFCLKK